jgi:hypothetical protein
MLRRIITSLLALSPIMQSQAADQVLRVPNTAENRMILDQLDLEHDCYGKSPEYLDFLYDDRAKDILSQRKTFRNLLLQNKQVYVEDVEALNRSRVSRDDLGKYHTLEETEAVIREYAEKYPDLTVLKSAGTTHENRNVWVLEISNKKISKDKANFLIMGSHHAREWISTEVPLALMKHLLDNYGKVEAVTKTLDESRIVIVPMVNPDGSAHSRTKQRMWRKNRRPVGTSIGVDNNRNYGFKWGTTGASPNPSSDTYRGPEPMSEIENQIVVNLQKEYKFDTAVSFHSYSELVLWPWGYTGKIKSKDHQVFEKHGKAMGQILGYKPMQIAGLYEASGGFDDMLYADFGVLTYTIELGKWFVPQENEIDPICEKSIQAMMYLFENAKKPLPENQDPAYVTMGVLQSVVRDMVLDNNESRLNLSLSSLSLLEDAMIESAMNGLEMETRLRGQIFDYINRHRSFHRMQN